MEHCRADAVVCMLARDLIQSTSRDQRRGAGLWNERSWDPSAQWIGAISQVQEALETLIGARDDPRSESVTLDYIAGYVLAFGTWRAAEVAVLVQ